MGARSRFHSSSRWSMSALGTAITRRASASIAENFSAGVVSGFSVGAGSLMNGTVARPRRRYKASAYADAYADAQKLKYRTAYLQLFREVAAIVS